jgi:hypothetical protein
LQGKGEKIDFSAVAEMPKGLDEMYARNFLRVFPVGGGDEDAEWVQCRGVVELVASAREPLHVSMVARTLGMEVMPDRVASLQLATATDLNAVLRRLSLLFPVREDQRIHVMHKSVVDWLLRAASLAFRVDGANGAVALWRHCVVVLCDDLAAGSVSAEERSYAERHVVEHSCAPAVLAAMEADAALRHVACARRDIPPPASQFKSDPEIRIVRVAS